VAASKSADIYDADGRLLAEVGPAGDAYVYRYDAAGNILSLTHRAARLSILRVSPASARPGQVVHLYGTRFSPAAAKDHVTIGGKATGAPKVVSPVQLDVVMPATSTGGTVTVKVGTHSAHAAAPLKKSAPPPVIKSVTASSPLQSGTLVVAPGAALVITGSGFSTTATDDRVTIGQEFASVVTATATRLTVTTPTGPPFSGRVVVATPTGSATGPDVFSVPGAVTTASTSYGQATRATSGKAVSLTFAGSAQSDLLLMDGQAGQRLSVTVGTGTLAGGTVQMVAPGGDDLIRTTPESAAQSVSFSTQAQTVFAVTLRRNGTNLLAVTSDNGAGTVPVVVTLSSDSTKSITPDGAAVTVSAAGNRVLLPFNVAAQEKVSVQYSGSTFGNDYLYLMDRTGNAFGPVGSYSASLTAGAAGSLVTWKALVPGTYDIVIDPSQTGDSGSVTLSLHTFADTTGTITPDGPAVTASITVPGEYAMFSFTGTAGTRMTAEITGDTLPTGSDQVELLAPDGSTVSNVDISPGSSQPTYLPTQTLPSTGIYQLVVDTGASGDTGAVTLRLLSVTDLTGSITPNGPAVTASIMLPGQRALYSFSGTAGQKMSAHFSGSTFTNGNDQVELVDPNGTTLTYTGIGTPSGNLPPATFSSTGTYELVVDPSATGDTGSVSVQLYAFTDQTATITPNGPAVTASVSIPGQRVIYSFSGTAGEPVSAEFTGNTFGINDSLALEDSSGNSLTYASMGSSTGYVQRYTLPSAGTYELVVDPSATGDTGSVSIQLFSITDVTGTITPNGAAVTASVTVPGQEAAYSFSGTAGQQVSAKFSGSTFSSSNDVLELAGPDGSVPNSTGIDTPSGFLTPTTLPATGTYQLVVNPSYQGNTGSVSIQLFAFADQTGTITPNGAAVTASITVPGQRALYSFSVSSAVNVTTSWTGNTLGSSDLVELVGPSGVVDDTYLSGATGSLGPDNVTASGTYQVVVDPSQSGDTGSVTLSLATVAASAHRLRHARPHHARPPVPRHVVRLIHVPPRRPAPVRHRPVVRPGSREAAVTTTLSGVVQKTDNQPLAGVTLSIGNVRTTSNPLGQFTLRGVPVGRQMLDIDGSTAAPAGDWGYFTEVVDLAAGFPNQVPTTIWMTRLDKAHAVSLPAKITKPIVVMTPRIPGLQLHIAPGTVIRDRNGAIVRKISITPIPMDHPPFPLPADTPIPLYFTIQPGGATITGTGVQLVYPNWGDQRPGTRMTFWSYGERWDGWWVYGHGTVSANGKEVIPDKGTHLTDFEGAMFNSGPNPPPKGPGCGCDSADPVDMTTGLFNFSETDLTEPDVMPLTLTRSYRQNDPSVYRFGVGTNDIYGMNMWSTSLANGRGWLNVALVLPDGRQVPFVRSTPDTTWTDAQFAETRLQGPLYGAIMDWNGLGWDLTLTNGLTYTFGEVAPLQSITDRFGDTIEVTHSDGTSYTGPITNVTSPNGRWMKFSYNSPNCYACVSSVTDNSGRTVSYGYNASQELTSVTDVRGHTESYGYDANGDMTTVTDRLGHVLISNGYNSDGTVATQTTPGGGTVSFSYVTNSAGQVTQATSTDQRGAVTTMTFDSFQEPLTVVKAAGTSLQRTTTYQYDPVSGLVTKETDPLGRVTTYSYDGLGDLVSQTQLAGTASARTITQTFDLAGRLTSVTDPIGKSTTFAYSDSPGTSAETITNPDGDTIGINVRDGNVISVTGPGGTTTATYDGGRLATLTDADGNTSSQFVNSAGFVVTSTAPDGSVTKYAYDPAGDLLSATDPLGGVTSATYDAAGNQLTYTDAGHYTTTYAYDDLYRLSTQTDPLGATQHFSYDTAGDLTSYTDRNGAIDTASYNLLGELTTVKWGVSGSTAQDTTSYTYDNAGRVLTVTDQSDGDITNTYDGFDDLTSQAQPAGTVTYTYDADGRPTSVTAGSAPVVSYAYDPAGLPTSVTDGSGNTTLTYDTAGRLVKVAGPAVTETYAYDPAWNITGITSTGTSPLTIKYGYNADGQQATQADSSALLLAPSAVSSAAYNADNELIALNGQGLSYDKNGALVLDGTTSYTWNARQQLTAVTAGSATTKISNDPFSRQTAVTTAAGTTSYLYSGNSLALATTAAGSTSYATDPATQTALLESGPGGAASVISDRLGSPAAPVSPAGTTLTTYSYAPFGTSSASSASTSAVGYAGYQQGASGLDATAARYYSPALGRFISQDPLGTAAGQNVYAYVLDNPVNLTDPSGLQPSPPHMGVDAFLFGALTAGNPGPVRVEGEGIAVGGYNTRSGFFGADIGAVGLAIGGHNNYGAGFAGKEITTSGETTSIKIGEGSIGAEIPFVGGGGIGFGVFCTGNGEKGYFFFVQGGAIGDYGSLGFGFGW
jgi:RHS repeat-associated protein